MPSNKCFASASVTNRKVLGCLNEAAFVVSYELENPRFSSVAELEDHFSDFIRPPVAGGLASWPRSCSW